MIPFRFSIAESRLELGVIVNPSFCTFETVPSCLKFTSPVWQSRITIVGAPSTLHGTKRGVAMQLLIHGDLGTVT